MIIHSIIPMETIFYNERDNQSTDKKLLSKDGIILEAKSIENGIYEIDRLFSTNPFDYLRPDLQPGTRIHVYYK